MLSWKTLIVKLRHYVETILDIFVPSFLFIILVVLRFEVGDLGPKPESAEIFSNDDLFKTIEYEFALCNSEINPMFLYTPTTKASNDTVDNWDRTLREFYRNLCYRNNTDDYNFGKFFLSVNKFISYK